MRTNVAYLVFLQKQEMEKVFPGEIMFCHVGSCQTLIRDSYSHLRVCVHTILLVCLCVSVCLHVLETVRAFAHYKVTCRMGSLQHDMLMA